LSLQKILIAFDGSENSQKALEYALDLAEKYSASLQILNVLQIPASYPNPDQPISNQEQVSTFIKDLRKSHEETLSNAAKIATTLKPNLNISTTLKEGDPSTLILNTASEGSFDLIVLGHRGYSRIKELLLGSTTERVAHLAKCAVLIIK
jgi:nucleotide-binding universal stress UspA family protein